MRPPLARRHALARPHTRPLRRSPNTSYQRTIAPASRDASIEGWTVRRSSIHLVMGFVFLLFGAPCLHVGSLVGVLVEPSPPSRSCWRSGRRRIGHGNGSGFIGHHLLRTARFWDSLTWSEP